MRYGVNGDPLKDGKLDLPELLEEPTPWHKIMSERERAKQRSREADDRALASGEKSREQLQTENGSFSLPNARVIFDPKSLA